MQQGKWGPFSAAREEKFLSEAKEIMAKLFPISGGK
jgi:hypothetical protein